MGKIALAVGAHPDDIEFNAAGTLVLLKQLAGYEIHVMTVANGSCGTMERSKEEIVKIRTKESAEAAGLIGAKYHSPLVDDLHIFYDGPTLESLAAVIREVQPTIVLTHPMKGDYMEDHMNTGRLAVTAAFARGMSNFPTEPQRDCYQGGVRVYNWLPHGLMHGDDRSAAFAEFYVNVGDVVDTKTNMLACHKSQKEWLDKSQGMDSYLDAMKETAREIAHMSGQDKKRGWRYSEGFVMHSHLGFCDEGFNPLEEALRGKVFVDPDYQAALEMGPREIVHLQRQVTGLRQYANTFGLDLKKLAQRVSSVEAKR